MTVFPTLRRTTALTLGAFVTFPASLLAIAAPYTVISQKGRQFSPTAITVPVGATLRFTNDDPFLHQIFVSSEVFSFVSDEQSTGQTIEVAFSKAGDFTVLCGIHPKMSLKVSAR